MVEDLGVSSGLLRVDDSREWLWLLRDLGLFLGQLGLIGRMLPLQRLAHQIKYYNLRFWRPYIVRGRDTLQSEAASTRSSLNQVVIALSTHSYS